MYSKDYSMYKLNNFNLFNQTGGAIEHNGKYIYNIKIHNGARLIEYETLQKHQLDIFDFAERNIDFLNGNTVNIIDYGGRKYFDLKIFRGIYNEQSTSAYTGYRSPIDYTVNDIVYKFKNSESKDANHSVVKIRIEWKDGDSPHTRYYEFMYSNVAYPRSGRYGLDIAR